MTPREINALVGRHLFSIPGDVRQFSTSWALVPTIAAAMQAKGHSLTLYQDEEGWLADFPEADYRHEEAPMAVAVAALLQLGVKVQP